MVWSECKRQTLAFNWTEVFVIVGDMYFNKKDCTYEEWPKGALVKLEFLHPKHDFLYELFSSVELNILFVLRQTF